jgi:NTE family protein
MKSINLALQGGGARRVRGVIDKFLEDGRIEIEGVSGTSGSMNAVVFAHGMLRGPDGARQALHDFWKAISSRRATARSSRCRGKR